ncbi:hypothetical protein PCE1_002117 [Barthelona sp. PCE]
MESFFVFNRKAQCLLHIDWDEGLVHKNIDHEKDNIYGFLFVIRDFISSLAPFEGQIARSIKTNNFALHYFQTLTGYRFVCITKVDVVDVYDHLVTLYKEQFVPNVVLNPMYELNSNLDCIETGLFFNYVRDEFPSIVLGKT